MIGRGEPLSPPIVNASVFKLPGSPEAEFQYGRFTTPTWTSLEAQLEILEGAPCVAFPSGMAAIASVVFATLVCGDRMLIPADGYFATRHLAESFVRPLGIEVSEQATVDYAHADMRGVSLVFVETPSNPWLDVCDLRKVCDRAHAHGAIVVVDNTTMTPLLQRPFDFGADVVIAADTKAPAGHSDVVMGHVACADQKVMTRVRQWRRLSGSIPGPFEAWLVHRGLETLEVRLTRMCESALTIATHLASHPQVHAVRYPGLPSDPSFELASRQMQGFGSLIGLTLADAEQADQFLSHCPLIAETTSFGSVHTSGERRARWGEPVADGFVRLSIGCEPTEPLWQSIESSLDALS